MLGDSHAMGWGVGQGGSAAAGLARKSGRRVLNAAVSSYGTARELSLLDWLDASRLRVLVVQDRTTTCRKTAPSARTGTSCRL